MYSCHRAAALCGSSLQVEELHRLETPSGSVIINVWHVCTFIIIIKIVQ